mmetsp:Transcript_6240/g.12904  ORF Transcript_6240/g.12904 Transcript_6240/m.12904 type:complete len:162 (-) Transcript_6240:223-708(-)
MSKYQPKNLFCILLGLLVTMVSIAEASTLFVGEWKLKEIWRENAEDPLPITRDGDVYTLKIYPGTDQRVDTHRIAVKVGNAMSSSIQILEEDGEQQKIKVDFVMSTRMMPASQEKKELEAYVTEELEQMVSMKVKGEGQELVLSTEAGARMVCIPSVESED